MSIVGAEEEESDGHSQKELLGGCVLRTVVDLLPHVEVVESTAVELEGHSTHVMEHDI